MTGNIRVCSKYFEEKDFEASSTIKDANLERQRNFVDWFYSHLQFHIFFLGYQVSIMLRLHCLDAPPLYFLPE